MDSVFLSFGSNLGFKRTNIRKALKAVGKIARVTRVSRMIRTRAYGKTDQPHFINCAALVETGLSPESLLKELNTIETELGRVRTEKWGPRKIDIDIIFYGDLVIDKPELTIPHPDMQNRNFVLEPLMELCPDFVHPLLKKSVKQLASELGV